MLWRGQLPAGVGLRAYLDIEVKLGAQGPLDSYNLVLILTPDSHTRTIGQSPTELHAVDRSRYERRTAGCVLFVTKHVCACCACYLLPYCVKPYILDRHEEVTAATGEKCGCTPTGHSVTTAAKYGVLNALFTLFT